MSESKLGNTIMLASDDEAPSIKPFLYECKFKMEYSETLNGAIKKSSVEFDGLADEWLIDRFAEHMRMAIE